MASAVIELGLIGPDDDWGRPDEPGGWRPRRGWLVALMLVAVGTLSAAAPLPLELVEITQVQLGPGRYAIVDDTVYTMSARSRGTTAIDLATGAPRWHINGVYGRVDRVGPLAILGPDRCVATDGGTTVAVEAATGRNRWRRAGVPIDLAVSSPAGTPGNPSAGAAGNPPAVAVASEGGGGPVMVLLRAAWADRCGNIPDDSPREARAVRGLVRVDGIDAISGLVRWTSIIRGGARMVVGGAAGNGWLAAFVPEEHRLTTLDFATGRLAGPAAGGPIGTAAAAGPDVHRLTAVGDLVVAWRSAVSSGRPETITAYDRRTLAVRWSVPAPAPAGGSARPPEPAELVECGALVCVLTDDAVALDPATGEVRWRAGRAPYTGMAGGLIDEITEASPEPGVEVRVHDPDTGRRRVTYRTWRLLNRGALGGVAAAGLSTGGAGIERPIIGLADDGLTHLAWLADGGATIRPIGTIDGKFLSCRASRRYLGCLTYLQELRIWRMRR